MKERPTDFEEQMAIKLTLKMIAVHPKIPSQGWWLSFLYHTVVLWADQSDTGLDGLRGIFNSYIEIIKKNNRDKKNEVLGSGESPRRRKKS